jgi:hypothetical protein
MTVAIATGDRCEGFDYRIYHRFHQEQELAYLQATQLNQPSQPRKDK